MWENKYSKPTETAPRSRKSQMDATRRGGDADDLMSTGESQENQ